MDSRTDQQLLRDYAGRQSEEAFAELVRRHVDLVYSAALRMVRDVHLAKDVTQGTFVALAQNARQLTDRPVLSGWLHRTAQNLAANAVRSDVRRRAREQEAVAMNELLAAESDANWENIAAHLDAGLSELDETDRDAVLLRYFEKKSAQEMAGILGISDEAAQKRVSRAVEKLRDFFSKCKITVGAGGLTVLISANAVQSAPVGLAAAISATALAGTAVSTSTIIAATKTIAMTTLQKTIVTATVAVLAGGGIYEARQAAQLREQNQTLQQQQIPLAEQIQQLQQERDDATNRMAELIAENTELKSGQNQKELLALRGKVTLLSQEVAKAAGDAAKKARNSMADMSSDPLMKDYMHAQTSRMVKRDYAKLFSELNLPQDKADALNDLIVKKQNMNIDTTFNLSSGNLDQSEMDKIGSAGANQELAVSEEIKQLLGADDYSKFKNYESSMEQRSQISGPEGFAQELPAGQELTSDQTEQLISAMAEVKQNFQFSSGAKPGPSNLGITALMMEKPASEINVDAFTAEMQQLDDQYLARAQSILTPDQITAFQGYLANQIQNLKMSMIMGAKTSQSGYISR